ncbi:hypothetical protein [Thiomicrorhabdus indica]|uniref:hypothetical protein n=1 Tax=Thiomicrorhabdus indica TaxID=2267253 RepID=UPI002AA7AA6C|nr:hypothetical protein [Thiomicrorhabdus indica]
MQPKAKLLLVDQNQAFVDAFRKGLCRVVDCELEVVGSIEQMHLRLQVEDFDIVLCSLNLPDAFQDETLNFLSNLSISVLVMTESYLEEVDAHIGNMSVAEYIVQDSAAAIEHAVRVTSRLVKNSERPIWILSLDDHFSEMKLKSLLASQRFPVRVFDKTSSIGQELGLSGFQDSFIEPILPRLILITGATLSNCHGLIEWLDVLRQSYPSHYLPVMLCGRPTDLRVTMKLLKYGVNDFYNLHFTPEEFYIRIDKNLSQLD